MTLSVPPFPMDDEVPSLQKMSNLLVCALPEPDRKAGNALLVQQILPVKLSGIEYHPRPQRLCVKVYNKLGGNLSARPANMRLHALKLIASETELQRLSRDSTHLAIARFLLHHTGGLDAERLERWLTPPVQDLRELSVLEIENQAKALARSLDDWKAHVTGDYPTEWAKHREMHRTTGVAIAAAASGTFGEVTGALLDFLRDAGFAPQPS